MTGKLALMLQDFSYTTLALALVCCHAPGPKHLLAANRALQYLKETVELGITYVSDPTRFQDSIC